MEPEPKKPEGEPTPIFVTSETKDRVTTDADREARADAAAGRGTELTREALMEMVRLANERKREFDALVADMTPERAQYVRHLRVAEGCSWRAVALACYEEWNGTWHPPSNQLMGMALCERAATLCGENYNSPPWR